jgi:glycosyltransferase 2 family protein
VALGLLAAIVLVVRRTGGEVPWSVDLALGIVAAAGCILASQLLGALRWKVVLGEDAPRWSRLARLYLGAAFFSVFLPSSAGGDAYRAAAISRILNHVPHGLMSAFVDRAFGVAALGVWCIIGVGIVVWTGTELPSLAGIEVSWPVVVGGFLLVLALGLVLLRSGHPRITRFRGTLTSAVAFIVENVSGGGALLAICVLSMAVQGFYILAWAALAAGVGLDLSPAFLILTVPVVSVVSMLPVSISGLGIREGTWVLLTRGLETPIAEVFVFSLSYFVAFVLVGLLGGALLLQSEALGFERSGTA